MAATSTEQGDHSKDMPKSLFNATCSNSIGTNAEGKVARVDTKVLWLQMFATFTLRRVSPLGAKTIVSKCIDY